GQARQDPAGTLKLRSAKCLRNSGEGLRPLGRPTGAGAVRGRKPTPTHLKVLRGNPGKRPLPANEPQPKPKAPPCPAHLDAEAKREWRRMVKELEPLGLLTKIDRAALAAYCQAWSRWVQAEEMIRKTGMIVKAPNTGFPIQNPLLP